jgi:hypothetical protein
MNHLLTALFIFSFLCCQAQENELATRAGWVLGTWENRTSRGSIFEEWTKISDDEYAARSYMIKNGDTVELESVSLVFENDSLFYIPTVSDQNEGQPVRFALNANKSSDRLLFENPEHDFPQVISYMQIRADSLVAEISGISKGQERRVQFPMRRISQ